MDLGLSGKKAIITGGSKGIGRAIADTLADEGCHVAICARDEGEVKAAVEALKKKGVKAIGPSSTSRDKAALDRLGRGDRGEGSAASTSPSPTSARSTWTAARTPGRTSSRST